MESSTYFNFFSERKVLLIILLNSATIFLQGFELSKAFSFWLNHFDNFFTIYFVFELSKNIKQQGFSNFWQSAWNRFDFVLVALALPSLLYWFGRETGNQGLDFLLIFRTARVFKFMRFFRFIPGVQSLLAGINRALKASVLVIVTFLIYNFIVAIIACSLFQDLSPEYFGNPLSALYSTFKIFTVEGWYEIPESMMANGNLTIFQEVGIKFFFIVILLTGGIFGLSLVNSVFVDAMVMDNNDELEVKVDDLNKKIDLLTAEIRQQQTSKFSPQE
ncbi:ion transporter [Persicobacter psychrovividus]|uniref:Ion transport domain-containing protein n=1 Tax=Persicobacter psychrovividus TaxID=387638 RepID=A0ABN6L8L1_9BACT|nr:hypothetical protein PEPS_18220 [Persicobacter psychrovividus]